MEELERRETAVVEAYQKLLLDNGLIDFDGIILTALRLDRRSRMGAAMHPRKVSDHRHRRISGSRTCRCTGWCWR